MSDAGASGPAASDPVAAPRAVVVGHGDFAAGIVSAVEQIAGCGGMLVPVSNRDHGAAELEATLLALVAGGIGVVFTDLPGGSTTIAARRVQRAHADLVVVTGVNLPTLLAFVLADEPPAVAAVAALEKARAALATVAAPGAPKAP